MSQEGHRIDDVSHRGMKTLLGGALEFALEVALSPSLLILASLLCFPPTLCALSIFVSPCVPLGVCALCIVSHT